MWSEDKERKPIQKVSSHPPVMTGLCGYVEMQVVHISEMNLVLVSIEYRRGGPPVDHHFGGLKSYKLLIYKGFNGGGGWTRTSIEPLSMRVCGQGDPPGVHLGILQSEV